MSEGQEDLKEALRLFPLRSMVLQFFKEGGNRERICKVKKKRMKA